MTLLILGGSSAAESLAAALVEQGVDAVRCHDDRENFVDADGRIDELAAADVSTVVIVVAPEGRGPRSLEALDDSAWADAFVQPLRRVRLRLQAAGELLGPGGRVIIVASNGGMLGVAGEVADCALEEGVRALAKSVALAWKEGGPSLCFAAFDPSALLTAAGRAGTLVPTLQALLIAPPALTGATIIADDGRLLAP